jgi:sorbitol/mannitol transport system permease protein
MLNSIFATVISTVLVLALGLRRRSRCRCGRSEDTGRVVLLHEHQDVADRGGDPAAQCVIVSNIGLLDNIWALVILYTSMNLPIAVWMMRSFFLEVPGELLEAASLDGASLWRSVREVILPLVSPGIAATALICVIFAWNEFFFAVNLTAVNAQTMPVYPVGGFIAGEGSTGPCCRRPQPWPRCP